MSGSSTPPSDDDDDGGALEAVGGKSTVDSKGTLLANNPPPAPTGADDDDGSETSPVTGGSSVDSKGTLLAPSPGTLDPSSGDAPVSAVTMPMLPGGTDKLSALLTAAQSSHHIASPQTAQAPQHQAPAPSQQQASSQQQAGGQQSNSQNTPNHGDSGQRNAQTHDDQSAQVSNNSAPAQQASDVAPVAANAVTQPASPPSAFTATNLPGAIGITPGQPASAVSLPSSIQIVPTTHDASAASQPDLNALAIGIAAKSLSGSKQFDISLDPPELGRVDVRLTVDNAGKAQAHLAADKPETLQMLQRDSSSLERALKDSGVQLANNGLQFSLKGQGNQGNSSQSGSGRSQPLALAAAAQAASSAPIASSYGLAYSRAGIDIRV